MKKTIFYLLRHGEVYNPRQILYGRLPRFPLSNEGKKRIHEAAQYFESEHVDYLYTSPLLRARQTSRILAGYLDLKPRISQLLVEVKLLSEGTTIENYRKNIQHKLYSRQNVVRGQESIEEIERRMMKFITAIKRRHQGKKILVVSHGDPIMIIKAKFENEVFTWDYKRKHYLKTGHWVTLSCDKDTCTCE